MQRFFFASHDNGHTLIDLEGLDFPDVEEARTSTARALAEHAKDVLGTDTRREIAIDVRRDSERPLLRATLVFSKQHAARACHHLNVG